MKNKVHKCAPLPFQGQKRFFATAFADVLSEYAQKKRPEIIIDLFGGSGLLSNIAKRVLPDCRVIYNDFDDYHKRLINIKKTNALLADIRVIVADYKSKEKLSHSDKETILKRIKEEEGRGDGYIDYITLSAALLFSGNYALNYEQMSKDALYNRVRLSDFDVDPADYLNGLEVCKHDYMDLYNQYKDTPGVIFIVDPPYLSTDTKTYNSDSYWRIKDYLNILKVLKGDKFIYFTSNKSSIVELCEWLEENKGFESPFIGAEKQTRTNIVAYNAKYTDMMIYKLSA